MTGYPPPPNLKSALTSADSVYEVEPGIWQQRVDDGADRAQYDSIGTAYDFVAGLDIYHRAFWGVSTREYRAFAEEASTACRKGPLLDAGCGSMLFTARAHQGNRRGSVIGTDASLKMLRLARARAGSRENMRHVALLKADLLRTPFHARIFEVAICLHVAHVLSDLEGLIGELRRTLKPGGKLFLTSVVLAGHWRDGYLRLLSRRGVMAAPRHQEEILTAIRAQFGTEPDSRLVGNMLFVQVSSPDR